MNTLSIPTTLGSSAATATPFRVVSPTLPHRRAPAAWLPAPAARHSAFVSRPLPVGSTRICINSARQSAGEKVMLALLAASAVAGIGYGFVCLLNLVQNWAVFHAGVATLVQ